MKKYLAFIRTHLVMELTIWLFFVLVLMISMTFAAAVAAYVPEIPGLQVVADFYYSASAAQSINFSLLVGLGLTIIMTVLMYAVSRRSHRS